MSRALALACAALALAGCTMGAGYGERNPDLPEPGIHFHGRAVMGVVSDADGNVSTVVGIRPPRD